MTASRSRLIVEDMSVVYVAAGHRIPAVTQVSLTVEPGQALGIVGESGCGKSTLAMAIVGLLDPATTHVSAGLIRLGELDISINSEDVRTTVLGRRIAVVFQNPLVALNPVLTIGRQLTDHMRWHLKLSHEAARRRAVDLLGEVGIVDPSSRLDGYPHEFSGGMLQRVTIAMALACDPELLIADEPTTALDATVQAEVVDLILKLRRERGLGLIWITHDLGLLSRIVDRVAVMYAGRIVEIGDTAHVYERPSHPYAQALLASVRSLWEDDEGPFRSIPGNAPLASNDSTGCSYLSRCPIHVAACANRPPLSLVPGAVDRLVACWRPTTELPP